LTSMLFATFLTISALAWQAHAQTNITADVCADPTAYTTCNGDVATQAATCIDACDDYDICVLACGCVMYQEYINCMASTCWNQVYTCEYQKFITEYFDYCDLATVPIPFWPAPNDAPNRCSCNLGLIYETALGFVAEETDCLSNATSLDLTDPEKASEEDLACNCCAVSGGLSAIYEICPDTIPALAGANEWLSIATGYGYATDWSSCGTSMDEFNCMADLGFKAPSENSTTFYQPGDFPANGTHSLSNVGGAVTAPPSGSVMSWHQSTVSYTVTASAYNNK
ncbi:hypothetical protein ASPZODRAFT_41516, partial [Penicilliopsis zonata CBS 506.65]